MINENHISKYTLLTSLLSSFHSSVGILDENNQFYSQLAKALFRGILSLNFSLRGEEELFDEFLKKGTLGKKDRPLKRIIFEGIEGKENTISRKTFLDWINDKDGSENKLSLQHCEKVIDPLFDFLSKSLLTKFRPSTDKENQAKDLLSSRIKNEYGNLKRIEPKNSSPDLVDEMHSLGVEVTRGLTPSVFPCSSEQISLGEELYRFAVDYFGLNIPDWLKLGGYVSLSEEARKMVTICKSGNKITFAFIKLNLNSALVSAVNKKLEKMNKPNNSYRRDLDSIDLFVYEYGQSDLIPEENNYSFLFHEANQFITQNNLARKFRYILISGDYWLIRFSMDGKIIGCPYLLIEPNLSEE